MSEPARPKFSGAPAAGPSPSVLLLVDWINPLDHQGAERLSAPALDAARSAARLKARLTRRGVQCVYANDNNGVWQSDFKTLLQHCRRRGGARAEIAALLEPQSSDIAVLKPRHSAFYETPLQLLLQQLRAREIIVSGLATEWCVLFTVMDAYVRGYSLRVPRDCSASASARRHDAAVSYMSEVLGADTAPSRQQEPAMTADPEPSAHDDGS
jgi:nicotinamidase-related amidase